MIRKTVAVLSVAVLAAGTIALPAAAASPDSTPVQIASCSPCKAKCGAAKCGAAKCNPCNPCAAKCGAAKCGAAKCNPCNPCGAAKCNPCKAS